MRPITLAGLALLAALSHPQTYAQQPNLHDRIAAYWQTATCPPKNTCKNPVIILHGPGIEVAVPSGNSGYEYVRAEDLSNYLETLPLWAWPKGPRIAVRRSDVRFLHANQPNDTEAEYRAKEDQQARIVAKVCAELGLKRTDLDGKPLEDSQLAG